MTHPLFIGKKPRVLALAWRHLVPLCFTLAPTAGVPVSVPTRSPIPPHLSLGSTHSLGAFLTVAAGSSGQARVGWPPIHCFLQGRCGRKGCKDGRWVKGRRILLYRDCLLSWLSLPGDCCFPGPSFLLVGSALCIRLALASLPLPRAKFLFLLSSNTGSSLFHIKQARPIVFVKNPFWIRDLFLSIFNDMIRFVCVCSCFKPCKIIQLLKFIFIHLNTWLI